MLTVFNTEPISAMNIEKIILLFYKFENLASLNKSSKDIGYKSCKRKLTIIGKLPRLPGVQGFAK